MNYARLKTVVSSPIARDERLNASVNAASGILSDIIGPSGSEVRAEWSHRLDSQGRPLIRLQLSDYTGSVEADFAPDELEKPRQVRYRLHRLWGDLLQVRSHKQLEELTGATGSG